MEKFLIEQVFSGLRHPTDPTLFRVSEGEWVTTDYINQVCPLVVCTFSLWQGCRYVPRSQTYENITREAAFTKIIYALNTREPDVNPFGCRYTEVRTRESIVAITPPQGEPS